MMTLIDPSVHLWAKIYDDMGIFLTILGFAFLLIGLYYVLKQIENHTLKPLWKLLLCFVPFVLLYLLCAVGSSILPNKQYMMSSFIKDKQQEMQQQKPDFSKPKEQQL